MSGFGILGTTKPSVDDIADVLEAAAGAADSHRVKVASGGLPGSVAFTTLWDTTGSKDLGSVTLTANLAITATDVGSVVGGATFAAIAPSGFNTTFDGASIAGWSQAAVNIVGLYRVGDAVVWSVNGVQQVRGLAVPAAPVNSSHTVGPAAAGSPLTWVGAPASGHPTPVTTYSVLDASGNTIANNVSSGSYTPSTTQNITLRITSTNSLGTDVDNVAVTVGSSTSPPAAPTSLAAVGLAAITQGLSWTAPAVTGGAAISGYRVGYRTPAGSGVYTYVQTGSTSTSYVLGGISELTTYEYVVAAVNSAGVGPDSASITATTTPATAVRFSGGTSVVEGTVGPVYNYTGSASFTGTLGGTPDVTLAASADGWIACKMSSTSISLLGFDSVVNTSWVGLDFGVYPDTGANRVAYILNGVNAPLRTPAPANASCMYRISRSGGVVRVGYSADSSNGVNGVWEEVAVASGHTAKLYPQVCPGSGVTAGPVLFGGLSV